jgi:hypothetical protein
MLLLALGLCVLYALASTSLGLVLGRFLGAGQIGDVSTPPAVTLGTAFLLGLGALAGVWLLLALLGWFNPIVVATVLLVSLAVGFRPALLASSATSRQVRCALSDLRAETWVWQVLAILTLTVLGIKGLQALMPLPPGDAAAFYMVLPKTIAAAQRIAPLPGYESFTQIGLQGELHYAALMALGSPQAARFLPCLVGVSLGVMLLAVGSELGLRGRGLWLVLVILTTSTAFTLLMADGKVDLFAAAFAVAAFYWAMQIGELPGKLALVMAGLLAGLSIVAKFSYLIPVLPGIVLLVLWRVGLAQPEAEHHPHWRSLALAAVGLGLWMILPAIPHIVKNGVLFAVPLAPFLGSGSQSWAEQTWYNPVTTRWIVLTYPLALTFGRYPMQYGDLSVLCAAFAPMALVLPRPQSFARSKSVQIAFVAVLSLVLWVAFRPSILAPRYILAPLLLFVPLVAKAAENVIVNEAKPHWVSGGIAFCAFAALLATLMPMRYVVLGALRYATGQVQECGLAGLACDVAEAVDRQARPGDRVYLGMYYRYWFRSDLLECASSTEEMQSVDRRVAPEGPWAYLFEHGFRFVVISRTTHASLVELLARQSAPAWLDVVPVFDSGEYVAFRLDSQEPARQPLLACRQGRPPAWQVATR